MLRVTLWHEPAGFNFYLRDPGASNRHDREFSDELMLHGFAVRHGEVAIRTLSEFTEVPITVEYDVDGVGDTNLDKWDHVVECSLETKSRKIILEGTTAPQAFGELAVPLGRYRVRIHFGGQLSGKRDGSSEDFYLLQIWPSQDSSVEVLKGELSWPRPRQPWDQK